MVEKNYKTLPKKVEIIEKKIEELKCELAEVNAKINQKTEAITVKNTLKVKDISNFLHIPVSTLYRIKPYLLPNCGLVDCSANSVSSVKEWDVDEFLLWNKKPLKEKKEIYKKYISQGKLKYPYEKNNKDIKGGQEDVLSKV